jgi:DNA-directed RNA polymerase specialized sigma24 family protein
MPTDAPIDAGVLLRHSKWLAQLARALVAREDEIEEVVQQAFAQARLRPPSALDTADEALACAELRRRVVEAVLAQGEPDRSAVILRFFEEQPVGAIARLTKSSEEAVCTRIRRGVAQVKEALVSLVLGDDEPNIVARALLFARLVRLARRVRGSRGSL